MNIKLATDKDQQDWDAYVWNHPDAVAYHQFAWGQSISKAYGFAPTYLMAEKNHQIVGILPLIRLKIPLWGSQLVSLPYCDLGGPLSDDDKTREGLLNFAVELAKDNGDKNLELRQTATPGQTTTVKKVRMILPLPASSEALMAGFKAKLRSQVKKPTKDGLTAQLGGKELLDDFYRVLAVNMRDLGSPVHSFNWFAAIAEYYQDHVRIGLVRSPDSKVIAAGIILLHKQVVSIPWASTLRDYNRLSPNMLLYWTFLSFAADNGFQSFDFGRSTPDEGTYKFKQQWGAQPQPLSWRQIPEGELNRNVQNGPSSARLMVEKLWQKLPVAVANRVGPLLRRFISL